MENRLDPFFYKTDLREVDNFVRSRARKKLGDFALGICGGATPLKSDGDKYYAQADDGVPLLRVQNITEEGVNFKDLIYINRQTHQDYLARSRVFGDDLLVTITGRIASAAVAPQEFEGNINQHSVVIKTRGREVAEYLAVFLNSNVGRNLALKRTTGGTRLALDYGALRGIPVIENLPIVEIMHSAYSDKERKENEARQLLGGIDDYLLGELGIKIPHRKADDATPLIFTRQSRQISGGRLDPEYNLDYFPALLRAISGGKYKTKPLAECVRYILKGVEVGSANYSDGGIPYVRVSDVDDWEIRPENCDKFISPALFAKLRGNFTPRVGEMIYTKDGTIGYSAVIEKEIDCGTSGGILRMAPADGVDVLYLKAVLSSYPLRSLADRESIGAVIKHLSLDCFLRLEIPMPPLVEQRKIAARISKIRGQAKRLQAEGKSAVANAKREVEAIILQMPKSGKMR